MRTDLSLQAASKSVAAILLLAALAGCASTQAFEMPKPTLREAPINSLALEQCMRVNGPEQCAQAGNDSVRLSQS